MADDSLMSPRHTTIDDNQQWWLKFVPKFNEWSDVNISRFLNIYKAHSILWDPTHSFYTDEPKRMKAYATIVKRLNLYGIKERECIKLIESLKSLYAEENERQEIAERCSQKYSPPPSWYSIFEEITECVKKRLREFANKGSVEVEPMKPWEACCPRLYTEDIWTPKHFRTNVADWFITSQDEQLLCTCEESSETNSEDVSSTETSSTCHRNSESDSSSGIIQCGDSKSTHSSISCCCDTQGSIKLPAEQSGVNVINHHDETQTSCNYGEKKKMTKRIDVLCKSGETPSSAKTAQCPSKNMKTLNTRINIASCCSEEISDDLPQAASAEKICCGDQTDKRKTGEMKCQKQNEQSRDKKLVSSGECTSMINRRGEVDIPKDSESLMSCQMNDASVSTDTNMSALTRNPINERSKSCGIRTFHPCGPKRVQKFCTMKTTSDRNEGSVIDSFNSKSSSSSSESHDTCRSLSDGDATPVKTSDSSSRDGKSVSSECASIPEREESDHRLDDLSDPTLCEKCAVDRVPVPKPYKNVVQLEDPRTQELDKYCRYRDWDEIYNIRSQVPDEDPATVQSDEDWLLTKRSTDEPLSPTRQNHSPTEADINLFIDPKSSEAREVSLNNEYKWENGITIRIDQRRHYACEASQTPGHKPAQLML